MPDDIRKKEWISRQVRVDWTDISITKCQVETSSTELFYKGKMQLLVPICLTMAMAYNNARLIAKPESNWLQA